jgi:hypothetical protein
MKEGAVLCLPIRAKATDTLASPDFGKWMVRNIDLWFDWARQLGLVIERMEDIVLVTGTHRTRSWTNVAFPGDQDRRTSISSGQWWIIRSGSVPSIGNSHTSTIEGLVLNCGPDGEV